MASDRSTYTTMIDAKPHTIDPKHALYQLGEMVAAGKAEPDQARGKLRDLWATLGVVSALIVSLVPFTSIATCDVEDSWIDCKSSHIPVNAVHVIASGLAMLGCVISVLMSTLMYALIGLLPEEAVADFLKEFHVCLRIPSHGLQVGVVFWLFDILWIAVFKHGTHLVLPVAAVFSLCIAGVFSVYGTMSSFVQDKLGACLER
eukprot:TRINITY_DN64795_c0_g1_i1.p1 TRINITY_DN64795_c0_g1~~TRINITY_DN64795_c0_g1_i1.p1  ORF type:complete len:214 (-),score=13.84 TRINITY_DN64795_c0_g1_i1:367-975(-)